MTTDKQPIVPANWKTLWSDKSVAFLDPLIKNIRYAFDERDHDAFLQLWQPGQNDKGSYICLGIRKQGKQPNGNHYSIVFAFGFFYEAAFNWPENYIDYMADRAVEEYARFLRGEWPIDKIHADEVLKRNANVSAPEPRRVYSHHDNPAIMALKPTQNPSCDVKVLNKQMEALAAKKTDMWGDEVEEEDDPLS